MKKNRQKTVLLIPLCAITSIGFAQNNTVGAGGDINTASGNISYSIGQVSYLTATNGTITLTQGVQQPYEIYLINGVEESLMNISLIAYPNPTSDFLMLQTDNVDNEKLSYQLSDVAGKVIDSNTITQKETTITMKNIASATYFLIVTNKNKNVKTFKIIKN